MQRKETIRKVDKQVFKRTAQGTKSINLGAKIFRGGTRL